MFSALFLILFHLISVSCGSQQMLIRVPYSRSSDSRMITVNHEPLTESSDENYKLHSVNEEYESVEAQYADIEASVTDRPVSFIESLDVAHRIHLFQLVSQNEGPRKTSQCIELQKLLKALNDLNNGKPLKSIFFCETWNTFRSCVSRWSME